MGALIASSVTNSGLDRVRATDAPPLRADPTAKDNFDGERLRYYHTLYRSQDQALRDRDRQIEENVRMLCGQQWLVYDALTNTHFDVRDWFTDAERRWRQRPVVNWLLPWFTLTHAKITENPPILTFLPGPDRIDADLAEVMDTLFKLHWREAEMIDVWDRAAAWLVVSGGVNLVSRLDLTKGPWKPVTGRVPVPVLDPSTGGLARNPDGSPVTVERPNVPLDAQYRPAALLHGGTGELVPIGEPHHERQGQIVVDVASPLEVRGQWGPMPWHAKAWHARRNYLTPEQVWDAYGVDCGPDSVGDQTQAGVLDRMLFGTGFFGSASGRLGSGTALGAAQQGDGLVEVTEVWHRPTPRVRGMEESPTQPGGRYVVMTRSQILRDGPRPAAFPHTSPIRQLDYLRVPGRPGGTSLQEVLNGPQRSYNKSRSQELEHASLCANPKPLIDAQSGIDETQWTNEPGAGFKVNSRQGVQPVTWLAPPQLGREVAMTMERAHDEITSIGGLRGADRSGIAPDASGEQIRELRFDEDRQSGPVVRRAVEEFGRLALDWRALMPFIYDETRAITSAGGDNVAQTIIVYPELFVEGKIHVVPDVESMLPEGRGERQQRVYRMWLDGAFGPPMDPKARKIYLELARFPHLGRAARPGGVDRTTAERENGKLLMGEPVPVLPWYDHDVHLEVLEDFMKSSEFLEQPPPVQQAFVAHHQQHEMYAQQQMAQHMAAQAAAMGAPGPHGAPPRGGPRPGMPNGAPNGAMPPGAPVPPRGAAAGAPTSIPEPVQ